MSTERRVRVFKNGRNQAVRIPQEFALRTEEAIMVDHRARTSQVPAGGFGDFDSAERGFRLRG